MGKPIIDTFEVRRQTAGEPHQFNIALAFALQAATGMEAFWQQRSLLAVFSLYESLHPVPQSEFVHPV